MLGDGSRGGKKPVEWERMRILLVEDERLLMRFIHVVLVAHGHQVWPFEDGAAALVALSQFAPDVLICDLALPGVEGQEVAKAAAQLPHPPRIVMMSGDPKRLERVGSIAHALLSKPFEIRELLEAVGPDRGQRKRAKTGSVKQDGNKDEDH